MVHIRCIELGKKDFDCKLEEVDESFFVKNINHIVLSSVLRWQFLKNRNFSHSVKSMSDVNATTKKPYRQKGTGKARQGSLVSPHFRGGGVVFGPNKRSFAIKMNKKVRKLAIRHSLALKFHENKLFFFDEDFFNFSSSSSILVNKMSSTFLNFYNNKFLLICENSDIKKINGVKNIKNFGYLDVNGLNVRDLLFSDFILLKINLLDFLKNRFCVL
ncbi:50S ribosomal protein L4 [Anaplasmataceae bacterium AB001_6]|nr:50S ribosomal protein L4 [Anaplasmataceae bacterium AB001_6]